jgi:Gnt-I system low-affinity gluconate transporter
MSTPYIILLVIVAVTVLLTLVLKFKLSAFIALLITSIIVGAMAGMPLSVIATTIEKGMGGTLGFVATVVGLGAIFGQMLESSGGAKSLADFLLKKFGTQRASWALMLTGFIIGMPVFFDVGFIILVPLVYALTRDAKKSVLYYAIPLLAGLAVTHTMVPPTPGPMAVASILGVDLGWVVLFGIIIGIPTAILAGPVWGSFIAGKINLPAPEQFITTGQEGTDEPSRKPSFGVIALIIMIPLLLILTSTFVKLGIDKETIKSSLFTDIVVFIGHPFTALIIGTLFSILLCLKMGLSGQKITELSTKALGPAGIIILVTGAGGVLKQVLVDSGIGTILAESIAGSSVPLIFLAWSIAAVMRITQGSATVAMVTAAGIMAPILPQFDYSQAYYALITIAIASGGTVLSHVNDSGFWIVGKYLGMNEKQTLKSWTVMETIIGVSGLAFAMLISLFVK